MSIRIVSFNKEKQIFFSRSLSTWKQKERKFERNCLTETFFLTYAGLNSSTRRNVSQRLFGKFF